MADADSNDFDDRFRRHFPRRSNDFALVVLKGHLLLEESVNHLLGALLHKPEAIEGANLRFHQKLCLIRALAPEGTASRFADAAEKLNTMRNRLAHHLDHPLIEALARDFLSLCEEPEDPEEPNDPGTEAVPLIRRLRPAIVFLCATFEGMSVFAKVRRDLDRKRRTEFVPPL
jgi:hypothetical protein